MVLATDGHYRSQFETGTSNGGLTARAGGDRWRWESRIFGGAYDAVAPHERPKYGALNYRRRATGGAPRFGSSYFRLKPHVSRRTTFCYPDSVFEPHHFGTADRMSLVSLAHNDARDRLDDAIEAHVHGPIQISCEVDALVLDPSYHGSPVESMARLLPCRLEWHPGFRLSIDELSRHPEYRGADIVEVAREIAQQGLLTPAVIGEAVAAGRHDAQSLKKVWHYVARFGDRSVLGDAGAGCTARL